MRQSPYEPPAGQGLYAPSSPGLQPPHTVSVLDSLRFAFSSDVGVGNLAMSLLLMIIPIVGPIVLLGWQAESHRRMARREGPPVLGFRFNEFGDYLLGGLVPFVAQIAAGFVAFVPLVFAMGLGAAVVMPIAAQGGGPPQTLFVFGVGFLLFMFVAIAAILVVVTSLQIRAELTGSFEKTFNPAENWEFIKRQWQPIVGHTLLLGLISIPLMLLGLIAFVVGIYVVAAALQFSQLHLRWQFYELDLQTGGQPVEVREGNGADV